jgi:AraC-like DNA-binding protein
MVSDESQDADLELEMIHRFGCSSAVEDSMRERVARYIQRRLESSDLCPESVFRDVGISRSRLYRLFEETGGVANYIRLCRLRKAREALLSPSPPRVSNIAYQFGFTSHAHFSRVFKRYFGCTPRECVTASRGQRPKSLESDPLGSSASSAG